MKVPAGQWCEFTQSWAELTLLPAGICGSAKAKIAVNVNVKYSRERRRGMRKYRVNNASLGIDNVRHIAMAR